MEWECKGRAENLDFQLTWHSKFILWVTTLHQIHNNVRWTINNETYWYIQAKKRKHSVNPKFKKKEEQRIKLKQKHELLLSEPKMKQWI